MDQLSERQQKLLSLLLRNRKGMGIEELVKALGITRNAVRQHLASLERDGYVEKGAFRPTAGRPSRVFQLTTRGMELFPRQYSWFSKNILHAIKMEQGEEGLATFLRGIAHSISKDLESRLDGKSGAARIQHALAMLNELNYKVSFEKGASKKELGHIVNYNCVYHHLAHGFPEVCHFDRALVSRLTDADVSQQECIASGGDHCRFVLSRKK